MSNGVCKIIDLGLSKMLEDKDEVKRPSLKVGTVYTQAPEVKDNLPYGTKADIYSIGIILLKLVVSNFPYEERIPCILNKKVYNSKKNPISKETHVLLNRMLEEDQDKRIDWIELQNLLNSHPMLIGR